MLASDNDGIYINTETNIELDLDETFGIQNVRFCLYDEEEKSFYMICNRREKYLPGAYDEDGNQIKIFVIGFYLVKFQEDYPLKFVFLTTWRHNLEIDDVNMYI